VNTTIQVSFAPQRTTLSPCPPVVTPSWRCLATGLPRSLVLHTLHCLCWMLVPAGYNNAFLVATSHDLAITYNDAGVLENMHVASFFRLVKEEK
jgi:hypothetical protein